MSDLNVIAMQSKWIRQECTTVYFYFPTVARMMNRFEKAQTIKIKKKYSPPSRKICGLVLRNGKGKMYLILRAKPRKINYAEGLKEKELKVTMKKFVI